jgi:acyl carrier protein
MITQDTESIANEILKVLIDRFDAPEEITIDCAYVDLDLDSLVMVEMAVFLSKRYSVSISEAEVVDASSVLGTATLIVSKTTKS